MTLSTPVRKRDAKGGPDPSEMLKQFLMVMEMGMEKITERLKLQKELENKMKENYGGED